MNSIIHLDYKMNQWVLVDSINQERYYYSTLIEAKRMQACFDSIDQAENEAQMENDLEAIKDLDRADFELF